VRASVCALAQRRRTACLTTKLSFRFNSETCGLVWRPPAGEPEAKQRYSSRFADATMQTGDDVAMSSNDPSSPTANH